jgi:sialate O-acetylesterase
VNIWGWANVGEVVRVTGSWDMITKTDTTGADGEWSVILSTPAASHDAPAYTLTMEGDNKRILTGILIGEVWLLSGQSNMEIPLVGWLPDAPIEGSAEAIAGANYPKLRLIVIGRKSASEPVIDFVSNWALATWTACTPATVQWFSAVGYFFGKELVDTQDIPVGLILCAWGGCSCEAFASPEALEDVIDYAGQGPWTSLGNEDNLTPTVLYNGMLAPIIPFTMRGVLWYQGETNVGRAEQLTELFPAMIRGWREDWGQGDFPFYFVQLAPWGGNAGFSLPELAEAQASALSLSNTGMIVTLDVGDAENIHPPKKEPVGHRLALWARARDYGETDLVYSGPLYKSMEIEGDTIRIEFDYAESGLKAASEPLGQFEIAGENKVYYPAKAEIDGQSIMVYSNSVSEPKHARYAWSGTAAAALYNSADLPAAAFRTDKPDYLTSVKVRFSADPVVISQGETSTLSWLTTGTSEVTLDGSEVSSTGSIEVSPDTNTVYTLGAFGETAVNKSVTVYVIPDELTNWSVFQSVTASSVEKSGHEPELAVDNNTATRWSTVYSDSQWFAIDFGESIPIGRILLEWETAYGKEYQIQVSDNQNNWTTIFTEDNGNGGIDDLEGLSGSGRYLRLCLTDRGTVWGYSLYEFMVFSSAFRTGMPVEQAPVRYGLIGNYPNPFNPYTVIQYNLKKTGPVALTIYDLTGRRVDSLFRGTGSQGRNEFFWNAAGLPSGPYFTSLEADGMKETRKILLLK